MTTTAIRLAKASRSGTVRTAVATGIETLRLWHNRARQRRHLARLTSEQLDDVGISPGDARAEATKPMWRA